MFRKHMFIFITVLDLFVTTPGKDCTCVPLPHLLELNGVIAILFMFQAFLLTFSVVCLTKYILPYILKHVNTSQQMPN